MGELIVALVAVIAGVTPGLTVAPGYFALAAVGTIGAIAVLTLALFRAMRPALRRPTNVRSGYHWTTFFIRRLGDPPPHSQQRTSGSQQRDETMGDDVDSSGL